jgi:hypothetical protein
LALAAWLVFLPAAAAAQPVTADQALANYRQVIKSPSELDCPKGSEDEIVVCAGPGQTESQRYRVPLPVSPDPGSPNRDVITSGMGAMRSDACQAYERCGSGGLSISVDLIRAARSAKKLVERVVEGDD